MSTNDKPLITFTIDGNPVSVPKGTTVYNAARTIGVDIPIFCYHDRMPPFGACRMCLVEVEKMPKLQASCTLEASEGMVVKTQSTMALEGRKGILEFLLINHPLDCPICDRGGECPLQENTLHHGPGESRFYEEKRKFKKRLPLGPVLMLDRERCIVCARCTRFGDVVAGDHALEFIDRGFKTEVGTPDGGPADSKFIGNTIMICPVGALTSQVYRFRARPWDNKPTKSTCTLCPVGCSMILDSRDGEVMRTRSAENKEVNDVWMCDKGWFGYEYISHPDRLQKPLIRRGDSLEVASWDEALALIASKMESAKSGKKIAAWGGNPLTVEENYLFQKLIRQGGGVPNVDHRIGTPIVDDEGIAPGMEMPIAQCETLSNAVLLGLDLTEEFPVLWLRLRQAINLGAKVHFIGHFAPEIAQYLASVTLQTPGTELDVIKDNAEVIANAETVFVGRQWLASPNRAAILAELKKLKKGSLNIMEGRGNSMGARYAGMYPIDGMNALQVIDAATKDGWDFLYVAGANPVSQYPFATWSELRSKLKFLVVQDLFLTKTAQQADVVLPALSFAEKGGTFINIEGRIQKLQPGKDIPSDIFSDAEIFTRIGQKLNLELTLDAHFAESIRTGLVPLPEAYSAPNAQPAEQGEGLKASFATALFDHGVRMKHNAHLVQMAKEPRMRINPLEAAKRGIKNNDSVSISANGNTLVIKARIDKDVAEGTIVLPLGFPEVQVRELGVNLLNGLGVQIDV
ncbi:MAG: NADH-quinone oxidoreductase subunit NuoG [Chlamydiales bacterium]|nr:NADH-quinone oxidoreductase subunit NuoG [Chlamydiales bacterium]